MDDVDDDTWEKICQISYHTLGVVHFILDEKKLTIISLVVDDHWWQSESFPNKWILMDSIHLFKWMKRKWEKKEKSYQNRLWWWSSIEQ